ncbi:hypothetical protein [Shewanella frigidimarina]
MIQESIKLKSATKIIDILLFPNYLFIHFEPTEFSVT